MEITFPPDSYPQDSTPASWMTATYDVWYRDVRAVVKRLLANPDFKDHIDYAPLREYDALGVRQLRNFMGGDWVWQQAVRNFQTVFGKVFI